MGRSFYVRLGLGTCSSDYTVLQSRTGFSLHYSIPDRLGAFMARAYLTLDKTELDAASDEALLGRLASKLPFSVEQT